MRSRAVSSVLAVIGIVALAATMAQAGGGQGVAASFNTFFECHAIDGGNVGQVVSTHDVGTDELANGNLRVIAGVLSCTQVNVKDSVGNFINGDVPSTELKCYTVSVKGPKAASMEIALQDAFFPAGEPLNFSPAVQMLCGPAIPISVP